MLATETKVTKNPVKAKIVALSLDKSTARVEIPRVVEDKKYGKRLHRTISLHVDTNSKEVKVGSLVDILPCRRISKTKSWKVISVNPS
jgi:small subunit ribosomal protein S17